MNKYFYAIQGSKRLSKLLLFILIVAIITCVIVTDMYDQASAALAQGSSGQQVKEVQQRLKEWGYYYGRVDGVFGTQTKSAVVKFQQYNGLTADGVVGSQTLAALGLSGLSNKSVSVLAQGSSGQQVKEVQQKLKNWGYYTGSIDGVFGSQTKAAVIKFQKNNGLTADGVVGKQTLVALGLASSSGSYNETSDDVALLAKVIYAESEAEPYIGKVAVGAVMLNRVGSSSFPNTLSGVIYQSYALESVSNGRYGSGYNDECLKAAREAVNGWDPSYGCLYFWNPATATSTWIWSRKIVVTYGKHVFGI